MSLQQITLPHCVGLKLLNQTLFESSFTTRPVIVLARRRLPIGTIPFADNVHEILDKDS